MAGTNDLEVSGSGNTIIMPGARHGLDDIYGSAYAGETEGIQPNTCFQQLPGVIVQAAVEAPMVASAQNGLFAATDARSAGYGGIATVSRITRIAASTIGLGLRELAGEHCT